MEIKEVLLTVCCKEQAELDALATKRQDMKNNLNNSPYSIRGDVEIEPEEISGWPALTITLRVRGDYNLERFRGSVTWLRKQLPSLEIASAWGLGWDGPAENIPSDNEKVLVATYNWNAGTNRILERRRISATTAAVHVHSEDFERQPAHSAQ